MRLVVHLRWSKCGLSVPLVQFGCSLITGCIGAFVIHIWDFLQQQGFLRGPLEIYAAKESLRMLDRFFDRTICHMAEGYEGARTQKATG